MSQTREITEYPIAAQPKQDALVVATSQKGIAEVQAAMLVAQRFPRDVLECRDRIIRACQRPGLAEGAMYSYARGGTDITGPSIRLAEAIAQEWGNLDFGFRVIEQRPGESTVETFAWDLERNTRQTRTFQVPHKRYTKRGTYALEDPRDIYEMEANQGARRLRACILGIIPGDIVEDAIKECEETLRAKADTSPENLKKMLATFEKYGVTKEQVEARLQRKVEAITPVQMVGLIKVKNSLKDGMSVPADWFETPAEATAEKSEARGGNASVKDALKARGARAQTPPQEAESEDGGQPEQGETPVAAPAEPQSPQIANSEDVTLGQAAAAVNRYLVEQGLDTLEKRKHLYASYVELKGMEKAPTSLADPVWTVPMLQDLLRFATAGKQEQPAAEDASPTDPEAE